MRNRGRNKHKKSITIARNNERQLNSNGVSGDYLQLIGGVIGTIGDIIETIGQGISIVEDEQQQLEIEQELQELRQEIEQLKQERNEELESIVRELMEQLFENGAR